jgi:hypothetical protein
MNGIFLNNIVVHRSNSSAPVLRYDASSCNLPKDFPPCTNQTRLHGSTIFIRPPPTSTADTPPQQEDCGALDTVAVAAMNGLPGVGGKLFDQRDVFENLTFVCCSPAYMASHPHDWQSYDGCRYVPLPSIHVKSDDTTNGGSFGCQYPPQATMPFCDAAQPTQVRVRDLVGRLTLKEKVDQLSHGGAFKNGPAPAIPRLGVAAWQWGTECLSGDVWAGPATSFPQSLTLASSFDLNLALRIANATGAEVRAKNNDVVSRNIHAYHTGLSCWSPVLNIGEP